MLYLSVLNILLSLILFSCTNDAITHTSPDDTKQTPSKNEQQFCYSVTKNIDSLKKDVRLKTTNEILTEFGIDSLRIEYLADSVTDYHIFLTIKPNLAFIEKYSKGYLPEPTIEDIPDYYSNEIILAALGAIDKGLVDNGNNRNPHSLIIELFTPDGRIIYADTTTSDELSNHDLMSFLIGCEDLEFTISNYNGQIIWD